MLRLFAPMVVTSGDGLVDIAIQLYGPVSHTIVEAHPKVYQRMIKFGWAEKENVKILFGRLPYCLCWFGNVVFTYFRFVFTRIFFSTYGEYYEDLRDIHQHLPVLLKPGEIYSFFNGLCGGNPFFHLVYYNLVSLELANLGCTTQLFPLLVKECLGRDI